LMEAMRCLEHFGEKCGPFEMGVDPSLEATIKMAFEVCGKYGNRNSFYTGSHPSRGHVEFSGFLVLRFDPVNVETLLIPDENLASRDGKNESISMSDPQRTLGRCITNDVGDRKGYAHMSLIVCFPVLHEVSKVLDVDPRAWNLPEASV